MTPEMAEKIVRYVKDVSGLAPLFWEMADTERRLPGVLRKRYKAAWPDFAPDPTLAYGYNQTEVKLGPASPDAISRYDWCLNSLLLLEPEERKIILAASRSAARRRKGPNWTLMQKITGLHRDTIRRRFERSMLSLWYSLKTAIESPQSPD